MENDQKPELTHIVTLSLTKDGNIHCEGAPGMPAHALMQYLSNAADMMRTEVAVQAMMQRVAAAQAEMQKQQEEKRIIVPNGVSAIPR